jgi:hypothetical protein
MNRTFKSTKDLFNHIQKQANSVLVNEVAKEVKQQMHDVIENVTYEQYTPTQYVRTHELSNVANMIVNTIDDHTIEIINTRHDGDTDVARVVATGIGYSWHNSAIARARLARNFYEDTYNFLLHTERHIKAFKEGMRKRGLDAR